MSSSEVKGPHPLLTQLQQRPEVAGSDLTDAMKTPLLADADNCIALMTGRCDVNGEMILEKSAAGGEPTREYVAAALALECGYFHKKNGKQNPSAAARELGKPTKDPSLVTRWVEKLTRLEASLMHESALAAQSKRVREEEAKAMRTKLARRCAEAAVRSVLSAAHELDAVGAHERLAARALALGLYARPVFIFSYDPKLVRKFCAAWLDTLAAYQLEFEGDMLQTIFGERCTPPRRVAGRNQYWYDDDDELFKPHTGSNHPDHMWYANLKPEDRRLVRRPYKYMLRGIIFGANGAPSSAFHRWRLKLICSCSQPFAATMLPAKRCSDVCVRSRLPVQLCTQSRGRASRCVRHRITDVQKLGLQMVGCVGGMVGKALGHLCSAWLSQPSGASGISHGCHRPSLRARPRARSRQSSRRRGGSRS